MKEIQLSKGQIARVDDADYPLLSEVKWCYRAERNGAQGYAVRHKKTNGKDRLCYMHRQLMNPGPGQEVIFLNHDRLDYRRENLKVVTKEEARQHHRVRSDSGSGIRGVRFNERSRTWTARIYRDGRCQTIGTFERQDEAIEAFENALKWENAELHSAPAIVERVVEPKEIEDPAQGLQTVAA